ncbi:hypothetical protein PENSTE_c003G07675 [Penicillium steckii]|uniref:DNA repair protein RAD51 homolog 3 n=1 Tax=Penicillium steckii TaxID=303698 RepID=A0A1V6TQW6_9EURO|nr:hypothetical protein PENSTE_c003G07675 [Penicillium steckii]
MNLSKDLLGLDQDTPPIVSISASQSLNASETTASAISTGLTRLDQVLDDSDCRGIRRGHITELFGPPGAGKTALALSVASHALREGGKVVWIDTGPPLPSNRLNEMKDEDQKRIIYFRATTLAHLLALLIRPPSSFPPEGTSLMVIDSVSSQFPAYFPNAAELKEQLSHGKIKDQQQLQWLLNRKWNVASDIATHLSRFASKNIAILAINQAHTKIKNQPRATLHPILSNTAWENAIHARLVVYRDLPNERFVEITKRAGRVVRVRLPEFIVSFRVFSNELKEVNPEGGVQSPVLPRAEIDATPSRKRKAEDEVADSQDEDSEAEYQWDESLLDDVEGQTEKDPSKGEEQTDT